MNDIVQAQWLRLMENAEDPQRVGRSTFVAPYAEMLQTAYAHRRLQVRFPWTGMWEWKTRSGWWWTGCHGAADGYSLAHQRSSLTTRTPTCRT